MEHAVEELSFVQSSVVEQVITLVLHAAVFDASHVRGVGVGRILFNFLLLGFEHAHFVASVAAGVRIENPQQRNLKTVVTNCCRKFTEKFTAHLHFFK